MKKILLALLAVLIIGGGWNYHRNANLATEEDKTPRPFKNLSVEQLDTLLAAYKQEREQYQQRLAKLDIQADPSEKYAPSDLSSKLKGFDRAQKRAERWDQVHGAMLDREVEIDRLKQERARRGAGGSGGGPETPFTRFWKRLTTL